MAGWMKLKGTSADAFSIGLQGQTFDTSALSAPLTWVLPSTNGTAGYVLSNNGSGVLNWISIGAATDSTVPYFIPSSETFINNENRQSLFSIDIDVEGTIEINGILVEVD